jgi:hypothetical protein
LPSYGWVGVTGAKDAPLRSCLLVYFFFTELLLAASAACGADSGVPGCTEDRTGASGRRPTDTTLRN